MLTENKASSMKNKAICFYLWITQNQIRKTNNIKISISITVLEKSQAPVIYSLS